MYDDVMHSKRTLKIIEWSVSGITLAGGIYSAVSQALDGPSPTGSLIVTLMQSDYSGILWAAMLVFGAVLVMIGLAVDSSAMKRHGWLILVIARLFQVLGMIVISGFFPMTWIYPFTIMVVMGVLYYHNSLDRYVDPKSYEVPEVPENN